MELEPADFNNPLVQALVSDHLAGMHKNSPPGSVFALDYSSLQHPSISFWVVWEGGDLLGFGALKELSTHQGEIKSMRIKSHTLGQDLFDKGTLF